MLPAVPPSIRPLLDDYIALMQKELPGLMEALYLHGSIALGAFNEQKSDIDFIAVLSRPCTEADTEKLRTIHRTIAANHPRWVFDGSYLQWSDLGQPESAIAPHPYHHDGVLHAAGHFEENMITWCVLKTRGVTLVGPDPQTLDFPVDWNLLLSKMRENLNTYWVRFTREPTRMAALLTDSGIQWAVLGVLRQYYTFRERDIISKTGAGEYALRHLPPHWHKLIHEAINIRERGAPSSYRFKLQRAIEAWRFLRYIIQTCNAVPI